MKATIRALLALAVVVGLTSCSSDDDSEADAEADTDSEADTAQEAPAADATDDTDAAEAEAELTISSDAFADGAAIPSEFTCDGANTQLALTVTGTPEEAEGLVVIVDDPDAPSGGFIHWVVWDLEPDASIPEGSLPAGAVEGTNGTGNTAWFGPCPPPGAPHNYEFQLSAVSQQPDLQPDATADEVRAAIADTTVSTAELIGTYERT